MPAAKSNQNPGALRGALVVIKDSFRAAHLHPQIFVYPYAALAFISLTHSFINATVLPNWYSRVFHAADYVTPHKVQAILGIVGFAAFYTALVTAYFTCAVSASVLSLLEDQNTGFLHGMVMVGKKFLRVTGFSLASVFFFPVGIYVQKDRLLKSPIGVLGSSLTLHMAQVAPSILNNDKGFGDTIRDSIDTLGKKWKEGLVLKVGMYLIVFVIVIAPKLAQHQWFKSHAASDIGWLVSLELAVTSLVTFKVVNSIFTTVLYCQAKSRKNT